VASVIITDLVPLRDRGFYQGMQRSDLYIDRDADGVRYNDDGIRYGFNGWRTSCGVHIR
jgi:hypothetical protein